MQKYTEQDGDDLDARRRRAALFATAAADDDIDVAVLPGLLEILEERDEEEDDYAKQKHEARKRQMLAKPASEQVRKGKQPGRV
jgi:hypothetical protein